MIIWGSRGESIDLGQVELKECRTCEKVRPFKLYLQYRYAHIYYVFKWVTQKKYMIACDICNRGWEVNTKETEASFDKHPIPFMTRFGWTFIVGFFAFVMLMGALGK